jgi:hypothetical protein
VNGILLQERNVFLGTYYLTKLILENNIINYVLTLS